MLKEFKLKKIGSSIHYATPVPLMSYYKKKYNIKNKDYPNAEKYGNSLIFVFLRWLARYSPAPHGWSAVVSRLIRLPPSTDSNRLAW